MNIYEVAKKSFFSKLFVFVVALLPIFFSSHVSAAGEADFTGGSVPTSTVAPDGWSVTNEVIARRPTDPELSFPYSLLRTRQGYGDYNNGELTSTKPEGDGYVARGINRILGTNYPKESIYEITRQLQDGRLQTNYYIKEGVDGPQAKLIGIARDNGFFYPPRPIQKLTLDRSQEGSTLDTNTEAGANNWFDAQERLPLGTTNSAIRGSDTGNISTLTQQKQNLQTQIDAKKAEIAAAANDPAKKAQLETELSALERQLAVTTQDLQSAQATAQSSINTSACDGITKIFSIACVETVVAILANMYLKMVSYALGLVGTLFDYSIELAVNSAEFIDRIGVVAPIWAFIRDMLNMTFIFILLWIAAHIILGKKNYTIRSNVVKVVVVAILINFSLFAAKIMVDASNLLTLQIYEAAKGGTSTTRPPISAQIMDTLGMPTMYRFSDAFTTQTIKGCGGAHGTIITVAIFGSIFMIILGLAFLFGAVLFFSRMANIMYLFIISPIWVWGYIMDTGIFRESRESWESKMGQAVKFPVVYMMFIFVGIFAFIKLIGLRSNQNLSFLTLFCVSDDTSLVGQLPLILNFCLVIWVMLSAIRYGVKNGAGSEGQSLGFTKKFNDSVSKRFGKWAENTWRKPIDFSAGAGKAVGRGVAGAGKAGVRAVGSGVSNWASKKAGRVAQNANTPTLIRDLAARLSTATKDPKIFGKTQKQATEDWKNMRIGKAGKNTNRVMDVALESLGDAPKFDPETDDSKDKMEKKAAEYAEKLSQVFFKKRILDDNGNRDAILAAARAGVKEEKDSDGNTIYKFDQALMRQKIADIRKAHMPGNDKGNRTHTAVGKLNPYDRLFQGRFEARDKVITARATAMVSNDGKAQGKKDNSPEALKEALKKHEEDLKKYPVTMEQLDVLLKTNPAALKGIGNAQKINENIKDIEEQKAKLKELEAVNEEFDPEWGETTKDHAAIAKTKAIIEKKNSEVEKSKQAILNQRNKIQKSINEINKKLEPKENKGDSKK